MNYDRIKNNKKIKILAFCTLLSITSIFYIFSSVSTNQKPNQINQPNFTQSPPSSKKNIISSYESNQSLSYSNLELPSIDPVNNLKPYSVEYKKTDLNSFAKELVKHFNLDQTPIAPGLWTNSNKSKYIDVSNVQNSVTYSIDGYIDPSIYSKTLNSTESEYLAVVNNFLKKFKEFDGLIIINNGIKYYQLISEDVISSPPNISNIVEIPLAYQTENHIIFLNDQTDYPLKIYLNQTKEITKFVYYPHKFTLITSNLNFTLTPIDEIKTKIQSGSGFIINNQFDNSFASIPKNIVINTTTKPEIIYRLNINESIIEPYYQFLAKYTLPDKTKGQLTIIYPALKFLSK